jgi:putative nucleotidyltransferase with HDIG domain
VLQAVACLGLRTVYKISLTFSFAKLLPRTVLRGYGIHASDLLRHCVAVAVISEKLAGRSSTEKADLAYTAGLVHDIGQLVVGLHVEAVAPGLTRPVGAFDTLAQEQAVLQADHSTIGGLVAEKWQLPAELCAVARHHHDPDKAAPGPARSLSWVVSLADLAATETGYGSPLDQDHASVTQHTGHRANALKIAAEQKDNIEKLCTAIGD